MIASALRRPAATALALLALLFFPHSSHAAPKLIPALGWDLKKQGPFPLSLAADHSGNLWVGTEDNGLWKYDPAAKQWSQFTTRDGLGDNSIYALAVDNLGRLWAGHLNHGVSVYNGDQWRNYGLVDGPLGDRVFAIAVNPKDNDVWIASDMGLARYSETRHDWDYYTRASGLPSDQIQSLDFDNNGKIYVATQAHGIAIASPADNYAKWQVVTALPKPPVAPVGEGLVSNLINAIYVFLAPEANPILGVLTPDGASASPGGKTWIPIRSGTTGVPGTFTDNNPLSRLSPLENWITTLGCDGEKLWVAYRKAGLERYDLKNPSSPELSVNTAPSAIFRAILALPGQPPLFAAYDQTAGGLLTLDDAPPYKPLITGTALAPLPAPVPAPTLDDAKALAARLGKLTLQIAPGEAFYFADDWRTQGNWVGRYGGAYVKLCGMAENGDQDYSLEPGYEVTLDLGPHHQPADTSPGSYHDQDSSDDLRSLYDPTLGHRRDAEENDLSNNQATYPDTYNGPDLWVKVKVPDGIHCLSLYFLNNDAHTKDLNKYRDYDLQVYSGDDLDPARLQSTPPLARTRVTDFWGGVYKQFLIAGPASYAIRVGRDHSFVTKLQAVFLDRVTGELPENPGQLPGFDQVPYEPPVEPADFVATPLASAAHDLWDQLDKSLALRGAVALQMPFRIWCYRAAIAGQAPPAILERWRWQIGIWTPDDRKQFDDAMKAAHDAANK